VPSVELVLRGDAGGNVGDIDGATVHIIGKTRQVRTEMQCCSALYSSDAVNNTLTCTLRFVRRLCYHLSAEEYTAREEFSTF